MNKWKKNMIAAAVLVTVCAGIYVNWLYEEDAATSDLTETIDVEKVMSEELLVLSEDAEALAAGKDLDTTATDYFAAVRLGRLSFIVTEGYPLLTYSFYETNLFILYLKTNPFSQFVHISSF